MLAPTGTVRGESTSTPPTTVINQPVIERVVETVRTVGSGMASADLDARLAAFAQGFTNRLRLSSNTSYRQDEILSDSIGETLAGNLSGLTIADSSWTGGIITNATITGGSISNYLPLSGGSAYLAPTTTLGIIASASSTIGNGTQTSGLTISGGATTTGNAYFAGNVSLANTAGASAGVVNWGGNRFIHNYTDPLNLALTGAIGDSGNQGRNIFMGEGAGNFTMGPGGSNPSTLGARNIGIGHSALQNNTTGWQNTAVGYIAQRSVTTGQPARSVAATS